MRRLMLLAALLFGCQVLALDKWFCIDQASEARGNSVKSCGIGYGMTEAEARAGSLYAARLEFWRLCHISSTCRGFDVSVDPGRIDCLEAKISPTDYNSFRRFTCYRLLTFTIDRGHRHEMGPQDDYPENL